MININVKKYNNLNYFFIKLFILSIIISLGIGDWGLGIGDWGLGGWGPTPKPKHPNPNPKTPKNLKNNKIF